MHTSCTPCKLLLLLRREWNTRDLLRLMVFYWLILWDRSGNAGKTKRAGYTDSQLYHDFISLTIEHKVTNTINLSCKQFGDSQVVVIPRRDIFIVARRLRCHKLLERKQRPIPVGFGK